jgi:uncharacterized protein YyaL (SSP411 family)
MLAGALLQAGAVLDDPWATSHALLTLDRLRREQSVPDSVAHTVNGVTGLLEDQVMVAAAAIDAAEATDDPSWLHWSEAIMDRVWSDYRDPAAGGLFDRVQKQGGEGLLPMPAKPLQDAPTPSGNGMAALNLARLAEHTGAGRWAERRDQLLAATAGRAGDLGLHGATLLLAADWAVHPAAHLIVADGRTGGQADSDVALRMHQESMRTYLPRRVVQRIRAGTDPSGLPPAAQGMIAAASAGPRAFACVGTACSAPADSIETWRKTLSDLRRPTPVST